MLLTDAASILMKKRERMNRIKQMRGETTSDEGLASLVREKAFGAGCSTSVELTHREGDKESEKLVVGRRLHRLSTSQPSTPTR